MHHDHITDWFFICYPFVSFISSNSRVACKYTDTLIHIYAQTYTQIHNYTMDIFVMRVRNCFCSCLLLPMLNSWYPTTVTAIMYIMLYSMRFTQFGVWKPSLSLFICFVRIFFPFHSVVSSAISWVPFLLNLIFIFRFTSLQHLSLFGIGFVVVIVELVCLPFSIYFNWVLGWTILLCECVSFFHVLYFSLICWTSRPVTLTFSNEFGWMMVG